MTRAHSGYLESQVQGIPRTWGLWTQPRHLALVNSQPLVSWEPCVFSSKCSLLAWLGGHSLCCPASHLASPHPSLQTALISKLGGTPRSSSRRAWGPCSWGIGGSFWCPTFTAGNYRKTGKCRHFRVPSICFQLLPSPTEVVFEGQPCFQGLQSLN